MIPRIIHYCWFGKNPKSKLVLKCINSWEKNLKDFKIIEWNEDNCDINNAPSFVKEAYKQKKWAFVSDFFRLKALFDYGGIYLDTDVEVIRNFDKFLSLDFVMCFEDKFHLCTAVIMSSKNNEYIKKIISYYYHTEFSTKPNSEIFVDFILGSETYDSSKMKSLNEVSKIFTSDYFSPINFNTKKTNITQNTYCIHHFDGTWKTKRQKLLDTFRFIAIKIFGENIFYKLRKILRR